MSEYCSTYIFLYDQPLKYDKLNPKVATGGQGTFCFKFPVLYLLISVVFHTFLKLMNSNKKYTLRVNPSTYFYRT